MASLDERIQRAMSGASPTGAPTPTQTTTTNKSLDERIAAAQQSVMSNSAPKPTPSPAPAVQTPKAEVKTEKDDDRNLWDKIKSWFTPEDEQAQPTTLQTTNKSTTAEDEDVTNYLNTINANASKATAKTSGDNANYLAKDFGASVAQKVQDVGNEVGYWMQNVKASTPQIAAGGAAMASAFSTNEMVDEMAKQRQAEAQEAALTPLETTFRFGDKAKEKVATQYEGKVSDLTKNTAQLTSAVGYMLPDIAASPLGAARLISALGIAGGATKEALDAGVDKSRATIKGAALGGLTAVLDSAIDGMAGIYGKGSLDDVVRDKLIKRVTTNPNAEKALMGLYGVVGEGFEELVEEVATRLINEGVIDLGTNYNFDNRSGKETAKDAGLSFLMGAAVSGLVNVGGKVLRGSVTTTDPKALADEVVAEIKANPETIATQGEISPSDGVSSQPTTDTTAVENTGRDNQGMPGFEAGENAAEASAELPDFGTGGARIDTVATEQPFKMAKTKDAATERSNWMPDRLSKKLAPEDHRVISEVESLNAWEQSFERDKKGHITNYDKAVDALINTPNWTGRETDAAMQLMKEAWRRRDMDTLRLLTNMRREAKGEAGRTLQAEKKWIAESGMNIIEAAAKALQDAKDAEAAKAMKTVAELSEEYDAAGEDATKLIDLIRKTSIKRHTNALFGKKFSKSFEAALNRIAERGDIDFLKTLAANGVANIATDVNRPSVTEVMKSERRLAMLSKASTTLRNLVSNGAFDLIDTIARDVSVPLDMLIGSVTKNRSVAVDKGVVSKAKRKGMAEALDKSFLEVSLDVDTTAREGAYEQKGNRTFKMSGGVMSRLMSTWEKYEGLALQTTDAMAKGGTEAEIARGLKDLYTKGKLKLPQPKEDGSVQAKPFEVNALVRATDRNNFGRVVSYNPAEQTYVVHFKSPSGSEANVTLPANQVVSVTGKKHQQVYNNVDDMIADMARQEALYRTFQDDTKLSAAAMGLRELGNDLVHVGELGLGDVVLPFAKTPANLATRALEYSPAGLAKAVAYDIPSVLIKAKKGTLTAAEQAQAVQNIGRGVTGSALIAGFAALSAKELIKTLGNGSDEDDKDKTAFEKMMGQNGTQWNLDATMRWFNGESTEWQDGDTLMSISFLEPFNAMMTTGALIVEDWQNEDLSGWEKMWASAKKSPEGAWRSISQLPMFESFRDFAQNMEYSDKENGWLRFADAAASYGADQVTSFIPNAVKGIVQGTDPIQRNAYTADTLVGQTWDNVKASLPGLRQTVDAKVDSYGNPVETEGGVLGFLNSNILPGQITHYKEQTGQSVIDYLYEITGNAGVYPDRKAPNKIDTTIGGKTYNVELDGDTKQEYLQTAGQAHEELLAAIEADPEFQSLTTEQQVEIVNAARLRAQQGAKLDVFHANGINPKQSKVDKVKEQMSPSEYINWLIADTKAVTPDGYTEGSTPQWQQFEIALSLPDSLAVDMIIAQGGDTGRRISAAVDNGISVERAVEYYRATSERNAEGKSPSKGEVNQRLAAAGFTADERRIMQRAFELTFK